MPRSRTVQDTSPDPPIRAEKKDAVDIFARLVEMQFKPITSTPHSVWTRVDTLQHSIDVCESLSFATTCTDGL
eukprot:jgi/Psemu1/21009/gm1.21009_g